MVYTYEQNYEACKSSFYHSLRMVVGKLLPGRSQQRMDFSPFKSVEDIRNEINLVSYDLSVKLWKNIAIICIAAQGCELCPISDRAEFEVRNAQYSFSKRTE
jgi:hypothetical protein